MSVPKENPAPLKTCINCGNPVTDLYCSHCSQKKNIRRLSFGALIEGVFGAVFSFDGKFPHTFIGLFKHPGKVIKTYLQGNRVKYSNPVSYFFMIFASVYILAALFQVELKDMSPDQNSILELFNVDPNTQSEQQKQFQTNTNNIIFNNLHYFNFLTFLFIALVAKFMYRKTKLNYIEHVVVCLYANVQPLLIWYLTIPIFKFTGFKLDLYTSLINYVYFIWCTLQVYPTTSIFKGIIKGLLTMFLGVILFMVFFSIITIVVVLIIMM